MFEPAAPELASFLTFLSDKHSLSASTVKGYHSAISTTIQQCWGPDLSNALLLHDVACGLSLREAWQLAGHLAGMSLLLYCML